MTDDVQYDGYTTECVSMTNSDVWDDDGKEEFFRNLYGFDWTALKHPVVKRVMLNLRTECVFILVKDALWLFS